MTLYRLFVRVSATGTTSDRRRCGRPRETTLRQDRHITLIPLRNRCVTARRTPGIRNSIISEQTVRNRLRQSGIRSRRPLNGMELKRRHRIARLQWARARLRWRRNTWPNILFSDESKFNLKFSDGRVRIYCRRRERFADGCVKETDRCGGGGVMVWGGISHVGKINLKIVVGNLNGIRYRDEILAPIVVPFIRTDHFNHVFQQNNVCVAMSFLNDNHIRTLPWPELSPDLNPIEHLWDELGRRIRRRVNPPESIDQLHRALTDEWNNITQLFVMCLIRSMRRRCLAVINGRGGHTRY